MLRGFYAADLDLRLHSARVWRVGTFNDSLVEVRMNCCDEYGQCRQGRDCPCRKEVTKESWDLITTYALTALVCAVGLIILFILALRLHFFDLTLSPQKTFAFRDFRSAYLKQV